MFNQELPFTIIVVSYYDILIFLFIYLLFWGLLT